MIEMGTVKQLLDRNVVMHEIDGMEFKCYRVNATRCIEAFGVGVLGVVGTEAGSFEKNLEKQVAADGQGFMQKFLRVVMISPRLGDVDSDSDDTVTWRTMGDSGPALFNLLMNSTNEAVRDFQGSSEVPTG